MSDNDKVFTGSIPQFYDEYLVPLIFESYANDLARRVAEVSPVAVLETAAGSGVVPRALGPLLRTDTRYVVTDLNQPMLDHAANKQRDGVGIEWTQADALALPFDDSVFDVVCCQFGVMFFPDKLAGYKEALRVLKPGGRFVFNVWDSIEHNEFADHVTRAAGEVFPDDPPLFLARTPHGFHDIEIISSDLSKSGFSRIEADTVTAVSRAQSPRDPAIAYCQGTPLRNEIEARDAGKLGEVTDHAEAAIRSHFGEGPVSGKIQGHVLTAHC